MDPLFDLEKRENIARLGADQELRDSALSFMRDTQPHKYSYNFCWLGLPVIQFPQDLVAMQEIIWNVKPDLIVETGVARGGSLVFYASMLALLGGDGCVLGIDVDIRAHNRVALEEHPLFKRIRLIEGSSVDELVVQRVFAAARGRRRVLLALDSNHTHDHVLRELELYSPLVRSGSYIVAFDTTIEDLPDDAFPDRPWNKQNNPKTAVRAFLETTDRFAIDREIEDKLLITAAREGFLRCVRD